jgi:hypothetical protein
MPHALPAFLSAGGEEAKTAAEHNAPNKTEELLSDTKASASAGEGMSE